MGPPEICGQISVQQIYDVRKTIETRTVILASLRRTDAEAGAIRAHAERMSANRAKEGEVMEHDLAFHLDIAKASRNPVLAMIVGAFQEVSRQSWPIGWRSRVEATQRQAMIQTHLDIAEAITLGDPQRASQQMTAHFDDSIKVLLDAGLT